MTFFHILLKYNFFIVTGSFDYSPKFIDMNQGDSSDLSSDQGENKILEDLAEAMNENLQINKTGKIYSYNNIIYTITIDYWIYPSKLCFLFVFFFYVVISDM